MREFDEEIAEIRKEVIESRGLIIKTNNLISSLAADMKAIAKRQSSGERRFAVNGAVAYVLFAVLSFLGLKLATESRMSEVEMRQETASREAAQLREELLQQAQYGERRKEAQARTQALYGLVRESKREEMLVQYEQVQGLELSPVEAALFADVAARFRRELSQDAFRRGAELFESGRFSESSTTLEKSLQWMQGGYHQPEVEWYLSRALFRLGNNERAATYAEKVSQQQTQRDLQDDGTWLLVQIEEARGRLESARKHLRTLLRKWPHSMYAPGARRQLSSIQLRIRRGASPQ